MPEGLRGIKRYEYLASDGVSPFASRVRSLLGDARALIALGLGLALVSAAGARWRTGFFPLIVGLEGAALVVVTPAVAAVALAGKWKKSSANLLHGLPRSAYRLVGEVAVCAVRRTLLIPLTALPLEVVALLSNGAYPIGIVSCIRPTLLDVMGTLLAEQVVLLATALTMTAFGLLFSPARSWSGWARKTYLTVFLVTCGPLLAAFLLEAILGPISVSLSGYQQAYEFWLLTPLLLNPVVSAVITTDPLASAWRTVGDAGRHAAMAPVWFVYTVVSSILAMMVLLTSARALCRHAGEHQSTRENEG